MTAHTSLI